jgi:gamma-glutamyltranspeptidase/glutathione hydrolase
MNTRYLGRCAGVALVVLLGVSACGGSDDSPPDTACQALASDGTGVVVGSNLPGDPALPEPASGYRTGLKVIYAKKYMVSTANPLASAAGCKVLQSGGSAADAAVAVQAVLGLTVPEATGLGSGGFMLYYDATAKTVQSYDGRESAPAAATVNYLRYVDDATDLTAPKPSARASGRSIGTIGVPRLIEKVQKDHGKLAWKDLFGDAIGLATNGFRIGNRLNAAIVLNTASLKRDPEAAAYFFNADGTAKAVNTVLTNPAYAKSLTAMAAGGADVIYTGQIGADVIAKIGSTVAADGTVTTPGKTTLADLAAYQIKVRTPVCTSYRAYYVCGMPPPTSGGITVASALGILENFNMGLYSPTAVDLEGGHPTVQGVHLVTEAERLAYSDRDKYVADTDFVPLPGGTWDTLLNKPYLQSRAGLIKFSVSMGTATAGVFPGYVPLGIDTTVEHGTNQFTIVDGQGNVLTATTTVESSMGSFHMTNGFLLNNQLTDFSAAPTDGNGLLIANRVQPGKRPRSSMAPTLVFKLANGGAGDFVLATGSPGGGTIPQYVVKTIVGALDWGLDAQQSSNLIDFGASNGATTTIGGEHPNVKVIFTNGVSDNGATDPLVIGLKALGHGISTSAQTSGVNNIMRSTVAGQPVWSGGTDPRREGIVLGDTFLP